MKRLRRMMVVTITLLVVYTLIQGGTSQAAAPVISGCQIFPSNNVWNTPIDTLPVHASSTSWVNTIGSTRSLKADFGSGVWPPGSNDKIGIPYTTVPSTQPLVNVFFDYDDESDPGPYPIPPNAPVESGGDKHVLVIERDNCILYEMWNSRKQANGTWLAGSGAIWDLNSNDLRPDGWTSADAAGLPVLAGLVRYDEVLAGEITHAIRFTVPQTRSQYIWPATHEASDLTGAQYPPMGARFRLKANFDISGFSPEAQVILRALKKYGMILADNGSAWYMSGVPDERWDNDILQELSAVKGQHFEAIDESSLMISPTSAEASQAHVVPQITINNVSQDEGSGAGTTDFTFTVSLSHDESEDTITVDYATANGTATLANNDYVSTSATLTFDPGESSQTVTVTVNRDDWNEPDETFFVNLTNPDNAIISDAQGVGTIENDDQVGDPSGLSLVVIGETQINLTWNDNSITENSYEVERSMNGTAWSPLISLPANSEAHNDTTVVCNTTYYYRVRAHRNFDDAYSEYSNVVNGTTPFCTMVVQSDHATIVIDEGTWTPVANGSASGGSYLTATTQNDVLSIVFEGNFIEVIYVASPGAGTFAFEVDNTVLRTVDTHNASTQFLAKSTIDYLENKPHILRVYPVTGTVSIDAFRMRLTTIPAPPSAPVGTLPVDVAYTQKPTFTWNHVATTDWYYLTINGPTVHKRWYAAANVCNGATCSVTMTSNLALGSYTWQVMGANEGGNSPTSGALAFDVILPGSLTLGNPVGNVTTSSPVFNWSTARDATWYRLWVVNNANATVYDQWFEATAICAADQCSHQPPVEFTGLGNVAFQWRVQAYAPVYNIGIVNGPRSFTVLAPTLISPSGNVNHASGAMTYNWTGVAGSTWYLLYISGPDGFVHSEWIPQSGNCISNNCTYTPSIALQKLGAHSWYVHAYSPLGYSSWSLGMNFNLTATPPGEIAKQTPTANATLTGLEVTFTWTHDTKATGYHLYLAGPPNSGLTGMVSGEVGDEVTCTAGTCSRTVILDANGTWTWYLAGYNAAGSGSWGPVGTMARTFTMAVPSVGVVTKTAPLAGANLTSGLVTFTWQKEANATQYEFYVGSAAHQLNADAVCTGADCTFTLLLPTNGAYTWYLRGVSPISQGPWSPNNNASDNWGAVTFTLNAPAVSGNVTKLAPLTNVTASNVVEFSWQHMTNATSYEFYLAGPGGFEVYQTYVVGQSVPCVAAVCRLTFSLPTKGAYNWYVRAMSAAGGASWGTGTAFNLNPPAPSATATLTAPADNALETSATTNFTWNAVANATWYNLVLVNATTGAVVSDTWHSSAAVGCELGGTCTLSRTVNKGTYRWVVFTWGPGSTGVHTYQHGVTPTRTLTKLGI